MKAKTQGVPAGSLQGVRVLDLTRVLAGPFCTRLMADMGAHVVKVEPPGGDAARQFEYITPEGVSGYFMQQNCGKEDVCLDLAYPGAKEVVERLVRVSDVVVENFRPGVMGRLGLDYDSLRRLNPSIILCSISAFGQNSPYAHRAAGDMVVQAMSGIASLTGDPDGPPQTVGMSLSDTSGGVHAFGAICAALYHRSVTGRGQFIDFSHLESMASLIGEDMIGYSLSGKYRDRAGNRHPSSAPQGCYRCDGDDEWIAISVGTDEEWERLCGLMGRPELADGELAGVAGRKRHHDELDAAIEKWTLSRNKHELMGLLQAEGIAAGAVQQISEASKDPQHEHEGYFQLQHYPGDAGSHLHPGLPFALTETPLEFRAPAPDLGQHNRRTFHDLLGVSADEFDALERERVIGQAPEEAAGNALT